MALLAVGGTVIVGLAAGLGSGRSAQAWRVQAQYLDAPLERELTRLRNAAGMDAGTDRLGALAVLGSRVGGGAPMRLVGSRDALRVVREEDRDDPALGVPVAERQYLLEVRLPEGALHYTPGDAVLVVSAEVSWPYGESRPTGGNLTIVVAVGG